MRPGWQTKRLGDVATLQRGFDLPTQDRVSGDFPLVSSSGISDTHHESAVRGPGVVTGRSGSIGNVFFIKEDFWPLNTVLYVKEFHGNDPKFVSYLLKQFDLRRFATGSGVPTLNRNFVHDELVNVPSPREQKRIVAILDEAFEGIETAVANAEKNFACARELYDNYLNSAFRQSGQEAVNTTLGTVCELQNGFAFKSDLFKTEGIPVLRISSIQNGEVCDNRPVFTSLTDYREDLSRYVVSHGDLLIAMSGATTGKVGFNNTGKEFLLNQRVGNFRPGPKLNKRYLYYFLYTKSENHLAMSAGSAQQNLSTKQIKEIIIPLPTMVKQLHLVRNITAIDGRLALLKSSYERKIAALSILRQAILGEAFSGRLSSTAAKSLPEAAE